MAKANIVVGGVTPPEYALGGTRQRLRALRHRPKVLDPQEVGQAGRTAQEEVMSCHVPS